MLLQVFAFSLFSYITHIKCCQLEYSYKDINNWPESCYGSRQSPINIDLRSAVNKKASKLDLTEYQKPLSKVTLTNTGHTVEVEFQESIIISGGPLGSNKFRLLGFDIHFGRGTDHGSEHTIDGFRYPLEIHFIHLNTKYSDFGEASGKQNGVLILAVIGYIDDNATCNGPLSFLTRNLRRIQYYEETSTVMGPINLSTLIPYVDAFDYFFYYGSTTVPNCNEGVAWIVHRPGFPFSYHEYKRLLILKNQFDEPMVGNNRPLQPLNGRNVFYISP